MRCTVCGKRFHITKPNVYQVRKLEYFSMLAEKRVCVYDAIDCPKCGCQHLLKSREDREVKPDDER